MISRVLSPANWGKLGSRGMGPLIVASATDLSTGSRFVFSQSVFDVICSDLDAVPLCRAAAASSAVPVVLSPVTFNNHGGTCNSTTPALWQPILDADNPPRPAARAIRSIKTQQTFRDSVRRPFLHLVDGGVSDNVGMRAVLDALQVFKDKAEVAYLNLASEGRSWIGFEAAHARCPHPQRRDCDEYRPTNSATTTAK